MDKEQYIIESIEKLVHDNTTSTLKKIIKGLKEKITVSYIKKKLKRFIIDIKLKKSGISEKQNETNGVKFKKYSGNKKIVIYTCIIGNYDSLYEPFYIEENVDYVLFTDNKKIKSDVFQKRDISKKIKKINNNVLVNRYYKLNPHELFSNKYDYAIYLDGNIQIVSNLTSFINQIDKNYGISLHNHSIRECIYEEAKILEIYKKGKKDEILKQITKYKNEGFPKKYGLLEACVIVTDLKKDISKKIMNEWWREFYNSNSMRDQLSLPYILWKNNIPVSKISTLGNNLYKNPKIKRKEHL